MSGNETIRRASAATAVLVAGMISGCGGVSLSTSPGPVAVAGAQFSGRTMGGQQPITGAAIGLYVASTTAYSGATSNILNTPVTTDPLGNFNLPAGSYSCMAGQQLYITAIGGDPGGGPNPNAAVMAALGDCSTLANSTYIIINEVSTVGSVFALAPFMSSVSAMGTDSTNRSGLVHAFASVAKLVNFTYGGAPGPALPAGATAPTAEIYTLANILAACVNSQGGTSGDLNACGQLFLWTTPPGGVAPKDTIQAALNIAHYPTQNVANLYGIPKQNFAFDHQLLTAPTDWTLSVSYTAVATLNVPRSTTVDAGGNIWVTNSGNNSVTVLTQAGNPISGSPFSNNGLSAPSAVAIDLGGNAWIANQGGNSVSVFTPSGAVYGGSPFAGSGTITAPSSIAIDAPGNVWIANSGNSTVTELTGAGTYIRQVSQAVSSPSSVAINPK